MKIDGGRCLYALYNNITKFTKIGVTDNIATRKSALENACGCKLEIIHITKHLLCAEIYEMDVHKSLREYRQIGEWFNIPDPRMAIDAINKAIEIATEDAIVENYRRGSPISAIATEYQVSRQAILARLKKYGVYDHKGRIFEKDPKTIKRVDSLINSGNPPKDNKSEHISNIDDSYDDITYLDGNIPTLPLKNLKRLEPNINYNGEWYQISLFKDGSFIYAYTQDVVKARSYLQGVRAVGFINRKPAKA